MGKVPVVAGVVRPRDCDKQYRSEADERHEGHGDAIDEDLARGLCEAQQEANDGAFGDI